MRMMQPAKYAVGATQSTESAPPTPSYTRFANLASLVADLAGCQVFTIVQGPMNDSGVNNAPASIDIYPTGIGTAGETIRGDIYIVTEDECLGDSARTRALMLEKILHYESALSDAGVEGGDIDELFSGDLYSDLITVTTTNLIEKRTGRACAAFGEGAAGSPCGISIPDLGNASYVVVCPAVGASGPADSSSCIARIWQ